jgi:hypothetical protein
MGNTDQENQMNLDIEINENITIINMFKSIENYYLTVILNNILIKNKINLLKRWITRKIKKVSNGVQSRDLPPERVLDQL